MTRYIDADAYEHAVQGNPYVSDSMKTYVRCSIQSQPTIDAVPVKRGKWIIRDNPGTGWYRVTCSECGEDVTATAPCISFYHNARVTWNYCPECGARMDQE